MGTGALYYVTVLLHLPRTLWHHHDHHHGEPERPVLPACQLAGSEVSKKKKKKVIVLISLIGLAFIFLYVFYLGNMGMADSTEAILLSVVMAVPLAFLASCLRSSRQRSRSMTASAPGRTGKLPILPSAVCSFSSDRHWDWYLFTNPYRLEAYNRWLQEVFPFHLKNHTSPSPLGSAEACQPDLPAVQAWMAGLAGGGVKRQLAIGGGQLENRVRGRKVNGKQEN